ncbi:SOWAHC [Branchiostoma lanceolatum]|uniref:SOWAHC protein n=1 Tax=Branchiostoma lanceolatum TaxID=7740 RepID=A0A8K0A8X8_BRALA|nr:SOWAHC [Branchiostoma lanceolatum]
MKTERVNGVISSRRAAKLCATASKGKSVQQNAQRPIKTALHWGAKHGNQEIVALMADAGLDVNLRTGYTPLHLAAMYGHDHIVKLLIDAYDADVTIRDYSGRRPGQRLRPGSSTNVDEVVQRKKQRSSSLSSFNPRHSMKDFKELVTTIGSALKMKAPPKHH